jgi:CheY-like chemotaxis protein
MAQGKYNTILLLEADALLRRMIALGLRQQEICVIEACSPHDVAALDLQRPDLLILDVDMDICSDWSLVEEARAHPQFADVPIVALSWEPASVQESAMLSRLQVAHHTKPFDARVLHTTVEQLLRAQAMKEAALTARAEEALLASYSAHMAPSIWPLVTAAGLLLAFIGMMLNVFFILVGCAIIGIALLLWTLTPPSHTTASTPLKSQLASS